MTMVLNNSNGTRKIGGQTIAPRSMADVNMSAKELRNHLFVRCGDLEVSGGSKPGPKPKAPPFASVPTWTVTSSCPVLSTTSE